MSVRVCAMVSLPVAGNAQSYQLSHHCTGGEKGICHSMDLPSFYQLSFVFGLQLALGAVVVLDFRLAMN